MDKVEARFEAIKPEDEVNWNIVKAIVEGYTRRHPEEVAGCVSYVKNLRQQNLNEFACSGTDSNMRHTMELPTALNMALTLKFPLIFNGKNQRHFLKLYPIFQVPEKL